MYDYRLKQYFLFLLCFVVNMTQVYLRCFLNVSIENTMPYSTSNDIGVSKQANMCLFMQLLPTSQYHNRIDIQARQYCCRNLNKTVCYCAQFHDRQSHCIALVLQKKSSTFAVTDVNIANIGYTNNIIHLACYLCS